MAQLTINGPAIRTGVHNLVLRDALIHSPVERRNSTVAYHTIKVGIREGNYTTWIGTWDESTQSIKACEPKSVLDTGRVGMRLKADQACVVQITTTGTPDSLRGSRISFHVARVGGRDGQAKPLVLGGASVSDVNSRVAIRALERQINDGGLAEWEDGVQLDDPVGLVVAGTFQGRLRVDSTTQISLQRHVGNWIEVDGEAVGLGSAGLLCTTTDGLLSADGGTTSTAPSASTLYYVYVSNTELRLCATAPSAHNGFYYLGTTPATRVWRFCGWAYTNASTQFTDSIVARHVVNYYNRLHKRMFTCPGYTDNDAETSHTMNSSNWLAVNGGTGSDVSFISNGEDIVYLAVAMVGKISSNGNFGPGISIDGATDVRVGGDVTASANVIVHVALVYSYDAGSAGRHTASFVARNSAGTLTIYADDERHNSTADPACSYLDGWLLA
jgi:hypothetical protein